MQIIPTRAEQIIIKQTKFKFLLPLFATNLAKVIVQRVNHYRSIVQTSRNRKIYAQK
jgi:hypothetical protein